MPNGYDPRDYIPDFSWISKAGDSIAKAVGSMPEYRRMQWQYEREQEMAEWDESAVTGYYNQSLKLLQRGLQENEGLDDTEAARVAEMLIREPTSQSLKDPRQYAMDNAKTIAGKMEQWDLSKRRKMVGGYLRSQQQGPATAGAVGPEQSEITSRQMPTGEQPSMATPLGPDYFQVLNAVGDPAKALSLKAEFAKMEMQHNLKKMEKGLDSYVDVLTSSVGKIPTEFSGPISPSQMPEVSMDGSKRIPTVNVNVSKGKRQGSRSPLMESIGALLSTYKISEDIGAQVTRVMTDPRTLAKPQEAKAALRNLASMNADLRRVLPVIEAEIDRYSSVPIGGNAADPSNPYGLNLPAGR